MGTKSPVNAFRIMGCFKRTYKQEQLVAPPEVDAIFQKYAENDVLKPEKFKEFLNEVQGGKDVTLEDAQKILDEQFANDKQQLTEPKNGLTLDAFLNYLLDPVANKAYDTKVHQDMTMPASHYFVYTGHNSYLTGNQLNSDCSETPIIEALDRGVRVVELDLWPSKKDPNEINVLHGGTMTSPVGFETCIVAIRDHAFKRSEYPVVITFEDHLTPELQAKAAEITARVLGHLLNIPDEHEKFTAFPSPEKMKGRILISTKPPSEYKKGKKQNVDEVVVEPIKKMETIVEKIGSRLGRVGSKAKPKEVSNEWGDEVASFRSGEHASNALNTESSEVPVDESRDEDNSLDEEETGKDGQIDHVSHPDYRRIISIRAGKPKGRSVVDALVVDEFVKRVSLSEPQLEKVAAKHPSAVIRFTERNLLRIYPYGLRVDSSNYNPFIGWSHGAQMVAFNMQGYGRPLWLVHGFFRANGGCGYVRKPKFLFPSETGIEFDPRKELSPKITVKVRVIMGLGWLEKFGKHYFDNYSPPDFYTRVGIAGVPADAVMKETKTIEDEWIPKWGVEFDFPVRVPELALLRVEVHEYDYTQKDDFAGQICLPISEIKPGFRSIPLMDKKGHPLEGVRLLFHFEISPIS